jgi:hypothetical protein
MVYTTGGGPGTRSGTPRLIFYDGTAWYYVHSPGTAFTG